MEQMPFIRGMAKTLCDKGVDPLYKSDIEIGTVLFCAGWPPADITNNFNAVKMMATIWFANEKRNRRMS